MISELRLSGAKRSTTDLEMALQETQDKINELVRATNIMETQDGSVIAIPLHASSHELGGDDQINVTGLSGVLATPQPLAAHGLTSSIHTMSGLMVGQPLRATSATTFAFGPLDLAGASVLTGNLPYANLPNVGGTWAYGAAETLTLEGTVVVGSQFLAFGGATPTGRLQSFSTAGAAIEGWTHGVGLTNTILSSYGDRSRLYLRRANGAPGTPTKVLSGEYLASITALGYAPGGVVTHGAAEIAFVAEEDYALAAGGTSVRFATMAIGSAVLTERWRITPAGVLQSLGAQTITTSAGALSFGPTVVQPLITDITSLGVAGKGWKRIAIEHTTNQADGLGLVQTLTATDSPRIFLTNSTDVWGYSIRGTSTGLSFATGAVAYAGSGTGRMKLSATALFPEVDDGLALGIAGSNRFSDFFMASGGVINWNNGNTLLTQSGSLLTLSLANFTVTRVGGAVNATVTIRGDAGFDRSVAFQTGSVNRWILDGANSTAETGADAGSNFRVGRFSDAGAFLGSTFSIARATGLATFLNGITLGGGVFTGALTGNVTGNVSGSALTVTQAAQAAITSLGTLTALTLFDTVFTNPGASQLKVSGSFEIGGDLRFGTFTILGLEVGTGIISIKDSGGTTRKLLVVA